MSKGCVDHGGIEKHRAKALAQAARGMETGVRPALSQVQGQPPHTSKRRNTKQIRGKIAAIRSGGKVAKRQGGKGQSAGIYE